MRIRQWILITRKPSNFPPTYKMVCYSKNIQKCSKLQKKNCLYKHNLLETPAHEAASCGKISKPREIVSNLHFTATFSLKDSWVSRGVQITYIVQTMSVDLEEAMINEWSEADNIVKQIDQLCFVAATNAYFNILGKMRKLDHLRQSNTLLKFVQWTSGLTRRNHLFILITCVNEYLYDKIHGNIWKH